MHRLLALCALALAPLAATAANASCTPSDLHGTWTAESPTRDINRLTINSVCADTQATVQLWAACAPADCDWGQLPAHVMRSGWTYSHLDAGYAQRHVFVRLTQTDRLHVLIKTDFSDPARPDYDQDAIFVKF